MVSESFSILIFVVYNYAKFKIKINLLEILYQGL